MGIVICQNIKSKIKVVIVGSLLNKISMLVYIFEAVTESVSKEKNINHDEARKFLISCINEKLQNNINGGNHDIYKRGDDEEKIPRHREVNERLAKAILRKWGL